MRAKSVRRLNAERLRRELGLSYNEIAAVTGISKSTLSGWLRDVPLLSDQEARLQARLRANRSSFAARALPINRERHQRARQIAQDEGAAVVPQLPEHATVQKLALAMLYLGEGAKRGGTVELSNMDAAVVRFFIWGLQRLYSVDNERLHYRLHLVEAARPDEGRLIAWWSTALGCQPYRFRKTQYDQRSKATSVTEDYHGVCIVACYDTFLKQRLLGLAHAYLQAHCPAPDGSQESS